MDDVPASRVTLEAVVSVIVSIDMITKGSAYGAF